MTTRRRLADHIGDALTATAGRVAAAHPGCAHDLAGWLATAHENIVVVAAVDRTARGRIDTRSYRLDVYLATTAGLAPLVSVRRRDLLIPAELQADDPQTEARLLLQQNGHGIPDDLSSLDNG